MNIKDKAKEFAIKAHEGQFRKLSGNPVILHPIMVGEILESFGFDEEIITAGYLHDTVEDTSITIEDIENNFGSRVAKLVSYATEPDQSLSWEERKQHTINVVKTNSIEDIAVILADKISNIECLVEELQLQGLSVFNVFKRGAESQLWYFEGVYNAALESNKDQPLIQRLGITIDNLKKEILHQKLIANDTEHSIPEKSFILLKEL